MLYRIFSKIRPENEGSSRGVNERRKLVIQIFWGTWKDVIEVVQ